MLFCLSLNYNTANSFLYENGIQIYHFKAKDSEIKPYPLCVGNISKYFTIDNMKKTGLREYVYDFYVDYNTTDFSDIIDINI